VLLVLVGMVTACTSGDRAATGEVVPGRASVEVSGAEGYVLIPTGRLDLTLGEPTTEALSGHVANDAEGHLPPDGGSWVPVHIEHHPFGDGGVPIGLMAGDPQPAEVALVVDGTTVDLGDPYRVVGDKGTADSGLDNVWVAVDKPPDEIESLRFAVTYDGLTQTLDPATGRREAGAAAALYDEPSPVADPVCPFGRYQRESVRADIFCHVGAGQRTPYLPGPGWADDGRAWLVVDSAISIDSVEVDGTSYDVETIEPHVTVNGAEPLPPDGRFGQVDHTPSRFAATWAFAASARGPDQFGITLELVLQKADLDDPGPGVREVTVKRTVELPANQLAAGG
jgi:hypothetical protein